MDNTPPSRRDILSLVGIGLTTSLAGCNSPTEPEPAPDSSAQTETRSGDGDISISISTETQPSELPSIWEDQSIEDFQAQFKVETTGGPTQATVSNGKIEINNDSEQWNGSNVTVQPGQMQSGEQQFTATASKGSQQVQDTAPGVKSTPGNYKLDIIPQRNEELRNQISQNTLEDSYLEKRGGFVTSDPVLDTYSSHEQLSFDKFGIDLVAYEWRHDNDYTDLAEAQPIEVKNFVDSIGVDTGNSEIEAIKSGEQGISKYPNASGRRDGGSFQLEEFQEATTLGEALDWVHPYLFNWQIIRTDKGPVSTEDALYAPALERAIEQNTNQGLEVHAWDVETLGHGTGLIYGKNADGSEELRFMETVATPVTATADDQQLHPLIENSGYLEPGNDGFEEYWHPLRFGWEKDEDTSSWGFEQKKRSAVSACGGMSNSLHAENNPLPGVSDTVAPTTKYVVDFTEKLRNFNQNDIKFETLYNQSKVLEKMVMDEDTNHIIYGDTENPQYAVVEDDSLIEDVWEDRSGEYDDFNQFLRDNPEYSMGIDNVGTSLDGEEMDDFGQQVLAGA
ncbi:hypothetical protein [Haloferax sulfurifontis]|uniref:Uncharacterized protein n=1 Tax=Haloferax sulfurifontis TaxID=255616 RepID=A0A830E2R3_9EURY|nr:hypothetical protein [Haloferax sulfurifontis]GGC63757.1 hypothetical protein GCM10007209_27290 [Haloferax sulfurifontis]